MRKLDNNIKKQKMDYINIMTCQINFKLNRRNHIVDDDQINYINRLKLDHIDK